MKSDLNCFGGTLPFYVSVFGVFYGIIVTAYISLQGSFSSHSLVGAKKRRKNEQLMSFGSFLRSCVSFTCGIALFHVGAICFGAEVLNKAELTLAWSVSMATMTILPTALLQGSQLSSFARIFLIRDWKTTSEVFCFYLATCVIISSWIFAIPIPLDWDMPWQPWPRTCLFGSYVGYVFAMLTFSTACKHLEISNSKHFSVHIS